MAASPSRTSPASTRPRKTSRRSSSSCATRRSSSGSAGAFRAACCWSARPAPARRCSPAPSPARRTCRSSPSRAPTSSRCSSASARRRVRDMFEQAKKNAPCIIFIDEIDAVGRHRGAGLGGGNDEREQTLNQLLVEMDGFEANEGIILIAATNRPDVLDPALLRPGRFDRQIVVPNPDVVGREKILKVHVRKVPLAPDVDLKTIARGTPGFSGADLMNLVNEAALLAARRGKRLVTMREFEDAKDKVMMGAERRTLVMTEDEKRLTAYHEGGHAIVALHVPATDPVHKATIIPRGRALGMVMQLPERDKLSMSFEQMTSRLAIMMGGRVAEEMIFGKDKVTSGAASDIEQATRLARAMVTRWGFSDELGTRRLRREPGRGLPRPFGVAPAERLRGDGAEDRRTRSGGWSRTGLRRGAAHPHRAHGRARDAGAGPARIRDADRRGDQGPARGQAAGPRDRRRRRRRARPRPCRSTKGRSPSSAPASRKAAWSRSRRPSFRPFRNSKKPRRRRAFFVGPRAIIMVNAALTIMVNNPFTNTRPPRLNAAALPPQAAPGVPERGGLQPPRFPFSPDSSHPRLTPPHGRRIPPRGTPLPNEGRLSERVDDMTNPAMPAARPANPNFSSGPCAKRPGWSLDALPDARARPLAPRQDRQGQAQAGHRPHPRGARSAGRLPHRHRAGLRHRRGRDGAVVAARRRAASTCSPGKASASAGSPTSSSSSSSTDARTIKADYGKLPDLTQVDFARDVVFTWNGTTSGVRVPNGDWIPADREGLTICDATSAAFAQDLALRQARCRHLLLAEGARRRGGARHAHPLARAPSQRLESYTPPWPLPKIFRMTKGGKLIDGIFVGETINTPSMLCVEDYLDALNWAKSVGGLKGLRGARRRQLQGARRLGGEDAVDRLLRRRSGDALEHLGLPQDRRSGGRRASTSPARRRSSGPSPRGSTRKASPTTSPSIATRRRISASGPAPRSRPPTSRS